MAIEDETAQSEEATAPEQTGLETEGEQAQALAEGDEQPTEGDSSTTEQPGGESAKDTRDWQKDYGELQSKFTPVSQEHAKMREAIGLIQQQSAQFGGIDEMFEWAKGIQANPQYQQFLKQEQYKEAGVTGEMDEETQKALDTVNNMIENKLKEHEATLVREKIQPLEDERKQQVINGHFGDMDDKYGVEWRDQLGKMSELENGLPEHKRTNPELADIEDLYWRAMRESGEFDNFAMKQYQKNLEAKKRKATGAPAPPTATGTEPPAKTVAEAYAQAKKALNMA